MQGPYKGTWFQLHRTLQTTAFTGGLLGMGFGLAMGTVKGTSTESGHKAVGFTVIALGCGQVGANALFSRLFEYLFWVCSFCGVATSNGTAPKLLGGPVLKLVRYLVGGSWESYEATHC